MCFHGILHNLFSSVMHQKRLASLILLITSALQTKKISVTSLGRGISLPIQERSGIRRSDRLIGNKKLWNERKGIYSEFISRVMGSTTRPRILIDWSQVPNTKHHLLRAALAGDGRSITLYEEVYIEKYLNNSEVELKFLSTLHHFLKENCKPIIITDAGFRIPWFKKIQELAWDYVGRVRGAPQYFDGKEWVKCKDLLSTASEGFRYVGKKLFGKTNSLNTHLYLIKKKPKYRKSTRRKPGGKRDELNHRRSGKEAWLLASSLPGGHYTQTKRVAQEYEKRMQIEQSFRDSKSPYVGFGLRNAYSRDVRRIQILLIIAMLVTWIAWLIGYYLEKNSMQLKFQSNSLKSRRVLSLVFLGCRALQRNIAISRYHLENVIKELAERE